MKKIIIMVLLFACLAMGVEAASLSVDLNMSKGGKFSKIQEKEIIYKIFSLMGNDETSCKIERAENYITVIKYSLTLVVYSATVQKGRAYIVVDTVDYGDLAEDGRIKKSKKTDVYRLTKNKKTWVKLDFDKTTNWSAGKEENKKAEEEKDE